MGIFPSASYDTIIKSWRNGSDEKGKRERGGWVTGTFHSLVRNGFQNATFKYYR